MNTRDFISTRNITATAERVDRNPNMADSENMDRWRVRLSSGNKRMTVYFSMGVGHNGREPEAADVLDCLASDAAGIENATNFEDWASEYGYDTDSRKAHRTYQACHRQADKLSKFLGDSYETLLFDVERL
jgi:hypothetical protein